MDLGSIFLILGLLLLVAIFISRPLAERKATVVSSEEQELSTLLAERDRAINTLQELDFDHTLGKIPEEDYPTLRSGLVLHGADILRKIDNLQAEAHPMLAEERLEAAIAARRQGIPLMTGPVRVNGNGVKVPDDELEQAIARRRRVRKEKAVGFCPRCGDPVHQSDRFCPKCGAQL